MRCALWESMRTRLGKEGPEGKGGRSGTAAVRSGQCRGGTGDRSANRSWRGRGTVEQPVARGARGR